MLTLILYTRFLRERLVGKDEKKYLVALQCNHFHTKMLVNFTMGLITTSFAGMLFQTIHRNKLFISSNLTLNVSNFLFLNKCLPISTFPPTIMDKIFETKTSFHVKQGTVYMYMDTTGKVQVLFFKSFCQYWQNFHFGRKTEHEDIIL